jgi:glycosyltransferase involved in cell wall biosynthesis
MYPRLSETFVVDEIVAVEQAGIDVSLYSLRLPDDGMFHADLADVRATARYLPPLGATSTLEAFRALAGGGVPRPERLLDALTFLDRLPSERRTPLLIQSLNLAAWAMKDGVGLLHAHFLTIAAQATYLAHLFTDIPFTVTAHAKDIYRHTVDPDVVRQVTAAAACVVTVCEANRRHLMSGQLDERARVERIYNGVHLDRLRPTSAPREAGLILGVGRLVEKKGYHILLEACRILADEGVTCRCVILGEGEERDRLLSLRRSLSLEGRVELIGAASRQRVLSFMRRARVLVAPSVTGADGNQDALPTVLLEALALGLPVVSTPVGGIPEIVDHGRDGLLAPSGDATALAHAIRRMLEDEPLWHAMSGAGPITAAERFDRRKNAQRLVALFAHSATRISATGSPGEAAVSA